MRREDINIRDPFILNDGEYYYMYGSTDENIWGGPCKGFDVYKSRDLREFQGPYRVFEREEGFWADENYWAPEVHKYKGRYYMIASFFTRGRRRACQIMVSDSPLGKFQPLAEPVTPVDRDCLDGTLYVENGVPYLVFCHEWQQIVDGEICIMKLSEDLKRAVSEPETIFSASSVGWVKPQHDDRYGDVYITDGPFFHKLRSGKLLMLWSSFSERGYAVAMAVSDSGSVCGKFRHIDELLFDDNGGHGMLFYDKHGKLNLVLHNPNMPIRSERAAVYECEELDDRIRIIKEV